MVPLLNQNRLNPRLFNSDGSRGERVERLRTSLFKSPRSAGSAEPVALPSVAFLDFLFTFDDAQTTSTTATDVSSNARAMSMASPPTSVAGAPPGTAKARDFTASGSHDTRLPYTTVNQTRADPGYINNDAPGVVWTFTATVFLPSAQTSSSVLFSTRANAGFGPYGYYGSLHSATAKFYWSMLPSGGNAINTTWDTFAFDDLWHDIVLVKVAGGTTSTLSLYIDGALNATKTYTSLGGVNGWYSDGGFFPIDYFAVNSIRGSGFASSGASYYDTRIQNLSLWTTDFTADQAATWHTLRTTGVSPKTFLGL